MDHTQDQHLITFGDIEYPMLAVNETADTLAQFGIRPVSYTHLTLPTNREV